MKMLAQSMLILILVATLGAFTATAPMAGFVAPPFNAYDSNADGAISMEEFQAQGGLVKSFHDSDMNRDLSLSKDELAAASASTDRIMSTRFIDDAWITAKVKTMLLKDDIVKGLSVNVETSKGMVQLSGWVNHAFQIDQAERVARSINGVKSVRNDLQLNKR
ncbi:MAG: BON domain-containing protein [Thiobacillus sp.]|nr:BON domain-containing protein [Thiobacillus sp.]